jgi:hypothetical protein
VRRLERTVLSLGTLVACALLMCAPGAGSALAQSTWALEQPQPPPPPPGVPEAPAPVGLGRIGDIEFWGPRRGVLITAGNPPTVPAGVWAYNGRDWHELSNQCGGTDGRIAWTEPYPGTYEEGKGEEFWTISDGRPGQAEVNNEPPPLEDDTLCRFSKGRIVESFAAPAFEANSYQPMHAAACLNAEDCWFAGSPLPELNPEIGAFQLHWDGTTLSETPFPGEGHAIEDMREFDGSLYESVELLRSDPVQKTVAVPPALHVLKPGSNGFLAEEELPRATLYAPGELPWALGFLHLSAGAAGLWAATGQRPDAAPEEAKHAQLTVLRYTPQSGGEWTQVLGWSTSPTGEVAFPEQTAETIAAEPGSGEEGAWLALQSVEEAKETERGESPKSATSASVVRISAGGVVSGRESLPSAGKGAAYKLTCPAAGDCWMATTEGWLFHLAPEGERTLPEDTDPSFASLITERPEDQGLPQTPPDSVPPDDSGLVGESPEVPPVPVVNRSQEEIRVPVALVSDVHTHLVDGTTLELRFHLAVKARIQLLAKRKHRLVAKTPLYTFKAGSRKVMLRLDRARWPTELHLVEHPLAPLPTVPAGAGGNETVSTSLAFPAHLLTDGSGLLR